MFLNFFSQTLLKTFIFSSIILSLFIIMQPFQISSFCKISQFAQHFNKSRGRTTDFCLYCHFEHHDIANLGKLVIKECDLFLPTGSVS